MMLLAQENKRCYVKYIIYIYDMDVEPIEKGGLKRNIIEESHIRTIDLAGILEINALFDR